MFTGIVEETGKVKHIRKGAASAVLVIEAGKVLSDVMLGDSIAVNGVCLTVTAFTRNTFSADVMHETLNRSSLGTLRAGSRVNLERAMKADGRFGGHIVSGHIDGTGTVTDIRKDDNAVWYTIRTDRQVLKFIVEKGSVAVDGISLTAAGLEADSFKISVIPHTAANTILGMRKKGDKVNVENDIIGKYVERLMQFDIGGRDAKAHGAAGTEDSGKAKSSCITEAFLIENGF